jgi:hypothetical protein
MTARKGAILFPRLYAKLCSTWGRAAPVGCFIFLAAFKALLEAPRLRKAVSFVRNNPATRQLRREQTGPARRRQPGKDPIGFSSSRRGFTVT